MNPDRIPGRPGQVSRLPLRPPFTWLSENDIMRLSTCEIHKRS
jgi:hypothetical protein